MRGCTAPQCKTLKIDKVPRQCKTLSTSKIWGSLRQCKTLKIDKVVLARPYCNTQRLPSQPQKFGV